MAQNIVLVFDCGATNIRVIAIDDTGSIVAKSDTPNSTKSCSENSEWHIWPLEDILQRFETCCNNINEIISTYKVKGITVTTFGVDGALINTEGELIYPIISWKCPRTQKIMDNIGKYLSPNELQLISGVGHFSFNTIYKLIWLKEHEPEKLTQAHAWLFISSLINYRLTGIMTTDRTMAGTSQLFDLKAEKFSHHILDKIGIPPTLFPPIVAAGEKIGTLLPEMARKLHLPNDIPIFSAGHDTQFALFGSGAQLNQPVLSSGTWEVLMVRTEQVNTTILPSYKGSTCELDAKTNLYNPGLQWLASGILEWIRSLFWKDHKKPEVYASMIEEALDVPPGCGGLNFDSNILTMNGGWLGASLNSTRGYFYRSVLEKLSLQLNDNLKTLEKIANFKATELVLVGGGSNNILWNQIKADMLNLPIKVPKQSEITVLGAACFAWYGLGLCETAELVRNRFNYTYLYYYPGSQQPCYSKIF